MFATPTDGPLALRDRVVHSLPVVLTATIGLLVGLGVTYIALNDGDGADSRFDGPPSVQTIERPAGAATDAGITGAGILEQARQPATFAAPEREPTSARTALQQFLEAEATDRSDASFALLAPDAQRGFGSVAAWRQTRAERVIPRSATVTTERPAGAGATDVTVVASRIPEITPFRGFVPATATEVWRVRRTDVGWRVAGGRARTSEPELAPDALAVDTTRRWVEGARRCEEAVTELQLAPQLLGKPELADALCTADADAAWSAEQVVRPAADLPDLTSFVAAYGPSVGRWARGVVVRSDGNEFTVVLGPLGQEWRVMGLTSAPST